VEKVNAKKIDLTPGGKHTYVRRILNEELGESNIIDLTPKRV
jgi:hypothetical protein